MTPSRTWLGEKGQQRPVSCREWRADRTPARVLLAVFAKEPQAVLRALADQADQ
jgi:hypothetical protein